MRTAAICLITLYQWCISPLLPPQCRFIPPCSEYARIAVERYGLWRGAVLALKRLFRCHPLCAGGLDPVPETDEKQPAPSSNTLLRRKGSS